MNPALPILLVAMVFLSAAEKKVEAYKNELFGTWDFSRGWNSKRKKVGEKSWIRKLMVTMVGQTATGCNVKQESHSQARLCQR